MLLTSRDVEYLPGQWQLMNVIIALKIVTFTLDVHQAIKMNNKALCSITNSVTAQKCILFLCFCNDKSLEDVS